MSNVPHELGAEFPGQSALIHNLKLADPSFATLIERYQTVNRAVHRMEARIEPVSEETEQASRRERMRLKDEIARVLSTGLPTSLHAEEADDAA